MKYAILLLSSLIITSCVTTTPVDPNKPKPIGEVIINNQSGQELTQADAKAIIGAYQLKYPTHTYSLVNSAPGLISVMGADQAGQPTLVFAEQKAGVWTVR